MSSGHGTSIDSVVDAGLAIEFHWDKAPCGKVRVKALLGGALFHCDTLKLDVARERGRFRRQVAARARDLHGLELEDDGLELGLLEIVEEIAGQADEMALPPADYKVVEGEEVPERDGIYALTQSGPVQLANCIVYVDRDITVNDGGGSRRRFEGRAILHGVTWQLRIDAEEFASGHKVLAAIYSAAGAKVQVLCRPEILVRAISAISSPIRREVTTDFGWTEAGDAFLTPSVRVDAEGIHPTGPDDAVRVDLGDEKCARHLDLAVPAEGELEILKRHLIDDLLDLHDPRVTFSLLAAAALGVLFRFAAGMNRPALWLVGLTGGGKSFASKLFQNFFGDFPIELGSAVGSCSSTANFLQRQGYFFQGATFLIDDFKAEVTRHQEMIRLLQNYADGSARGRLNSDATTNVSREIRGILVATGEATPDQSPSSMARTVIVEVPSIAKDVDRGARCVALRRRYPALMAGFIRHVIAGGRGSAFAARVAELQRIYYAPIVGAQNDLRIAGNHALLGAAFEEIAAFLGEGDPAWARRSRRYVEEDLAELRDAMVRGVREQQPSEIFLSTLRTLIESGRVRIHRWPTPTAGLTGSNAPMIGKVAQATARPWATFDIHTAMALEAVQESLRKQGRPPLATTARGLLDQLAADGKLLDEDDRPIDPDAPGRRTWSINLGGSTCRAFRISREVLLGPA